MAWHDGNHSPSDLRTNRCSAETARATLAYGQSPEPEQIRALVEMGLTDAQIGERYQRSRSWAKWLRGRYGIRGQPSGTGRRRPGDGTARWGGGVLVLTPSARVAAAPARAPSLEGLDEECRRWLERGGRITRVEPPPASDPALPVRPRYRAF